jgi:hypothetical protein
MKSGLLKLAAVAAAITAAQGTATSARAAPVTQDDFMLATTANLVSLCGADKADPLYTAAINFCHGFAVGTYTMIQIEDAASRSKRKAICLPNPSPTRDQAIAAFVAWASGRPKTLASSPTDGIGEYVMAQYPCK